MSIIQDIKAIGHREMCTLVNERPFRIEYITDKELLIRAGRHKGEYSIKLCELEQADQALLGKKKLRLMDIQCERKITSSYIAAILAQIRKVRVQIKKPSCLFLLENVVDNIDDYSAISYLHPEDLDANEAKKKEIGEKAESIVMEHERNKLMRLGLQKLVDNIQQVSKLNCAAGYDVLSFDEQGKPIYIEVKGSLGDAPTCFVSANQIDKGKEIGDNFFVYHVKNVFSPECFIEILSISNLKLRPIKYKAEYCPSLGNNVKP